MTVSTSTPRRVRYNGNGSTTAFAFNFPLTKQSANVSNLEVYLTNNSTGAETLQTEVTHYTVSGGSITGSPTTATVNFVSAPASGYTVTIIGVEPNTQSLDLIENGDQPSEAIERQLDSLTLQIIDSQEKLERAIIATPGSGITDISIATPIAGYMTKWDDTASILESVDPDEVTHLELSSTGLVSCTQLDPRTYSGRTITGGSGITVTNGNGVSGNPTIAVDINGLTTDGTPDTAADYVMTYDASATTNKKVLLSSISSGGAAAGVTTSVTQASHGFAVGDVLYLSGTTYTKAIATSAAASEVVGIVSAVANVNTFTLAMGGRVTGLSGLTAGECYFLSPSSAGAITTTEPSTAGQISKPLGVADSTTSLIFINMRGSEIATNLAAADQSAMETATSTTTFVTPGRLHYHPGVAKVWAVTDYAGASTASYNVSSITDTGTGQVTVNFTTAFSSTNYCAVATAGSGSNRPCTISTKNTSSVLVFTWNDITTATDATTLNVMCFGDQ